jgi:hypothetical protein
MAEKKPKEVMDMWGALKSQRSTWESHWQDLGDFIIPRKNQFTRDPVVPGEKKNVLLFDTTAQQGNELLAGALHGLLTSPNQFWFELTTGSEQLDGVEEVQSWLHDSMKRMHGVLNNSNFQSQVHEYYLDLSGIGTSALAVMEDEKQVVRFRSYPVSEVVIEENHLGVVDQVYRRFMWSVDKIAREFGEEAISDDMRRILEKDPMHEFTIVHGIYPRSVLFNKKDKAGRPFISQFVLEEEERNLRVSGFNEFPWIVSRWSVISGEKYGRGPGMVALPEAKTLNKMVETTLKGAQKTIDPPLELSDDGFIFPIVTKPGGLIFKRPGTEQIRPVLNDARIDFGFQFIAEYRNKIRDAFFIDQLQLQTGPQMTATEVLQRTEERMRLLGPLLGRQQAEFLRPLIDRVFGIMVRRGMFAEAPEQLSGANLDVTYTSTIARVQKTTEARNIQQMFASAAPFLQLDPSGVDNFDVDAIVRKLARTFGVDPVILKDVEAIQQQREVRAQQAQQQAQLAQANAQAEIVEKQSKAQANQAAAANQQES